jgi:anthranilate synthase component 1
LFEDLPPPSADALGFPDFIFWIAESLIVNEAGGSTTIICTAFGSDDQAEAASSFHAARERLERLAEGARSDEREPSLPASRIPDDAPIEVDLPDPVFAGVVTALKSAIARGDIFQVVPSRTFRTPCADPFSAYRALRRSDESPYHFFVAAQGHQLFGASPETSVRVQHREGSLRVEVKPIAGTRRRGWNGDEDNRIEAELRLDDKEVAEHMMLIDLARNDVARVSASGTRHVARLLTVERYARVMHLVSAVEGQLQAGYDALHAAQACLNVGTLSGAPKIKATELIRLVEGTKRGPYGGAVGWIAGNGELETAVVIRSAIVTDGIAHVRAGAGVVHDSDPLAEADETRRKAAAVLSAIRSVEVDA